MKELCCGHRQGDNGNGLKNSYGFTGDKMSNNKKMIDIFNEGKLVKLEFTTEQDEDFLLKHMRPTSISYSAKKGGTIDATMNFIQYQPTAWELFKDWLLSKLYRRRGYW